MYVFCMCLRHYYQYFRCNNIYNDEQRYRLEASVHELVTFTVFSSFLPSTGIKTSVNSTTKKNLSIYIQVVYRISIQQKKTHQAHKKTPFIIKLTPTGDET